MSNKFFDFGIMNLDIKGGSESIKAIEQSYTYLDTPKAKFNHDPNIEKKEQRISF